MQSDKEFFKLFSTNSNLLLDFLGIQSKCKYSMKSIELKEISRRTDGFLEPEDDTQIKYFLEFQCYKDETIYHRLAISMGIYGCQYPKKEIKGIILFTEESLDPKSQPWYSLSKLENPMIYVFYLTEKIKESEKKDNENPVLLVFKPFIIDDEIILKKNCKMWYNKLGKNLKSKTEIEIYNAVFINWLMLKFNDKDYKEVYKMLGITTPLEETLAYKQIFAEGVIEGEKNGEIKGEIKGQEGQIEGLHAQLSLIEDFYKKKYIPNEEYQQQRQILEKKLKELKNSLKKMKKTIITNEV